MIYTIWTLDARAQEKTTTDYKVILLPEFYQYKPVTVTDTTWKYECYDHQNNLINVDELSDIDSVEIINYLMCYYQHPKRGNSPISPPYLQQKLYLYARNDDGTWRCRDMASGRKTGLKEDKKKIVRSDTVMAHNSAKGLTPPIIHQYYRVFTVDLKTVRAHKE